jgi:photosystem II stability/assembly factor-like uncharacterized protein
MLGWAVTYGGLLYHTTDGGYIWVFQDSVGRGRDSRVPIRDVQFTTPDSGWAVGGIAGDNVIARTTNGGQAWTYARPGGSSLRDVAMVNSRVGWFTVWGNFSPFIARTTNGGESWETQSFNPTDQQGFESISMANETLGWVCGDRGKIFRTTNGGVTLVQESNEQHPKLFALFQNYPNSFNPSTRVNYALPEDGFVSLKVFDVLGREVAMLVQEYRQAGTHQVHFDASGLSSGTYIYRIAVGRFLATKKMMVIR